MIELLSSASEASADKLEVLVELDSTGVDLILFAEAYAAGFTSVSFTDITDGGAGDNVLTDLPLVNNGNFSRFMRLRYILNPGIKGAGHQFLLSCATDGYPCLQAWAFTGVQGIIANNTKSQGATAATIQATAINVEAGYLGFSAATCSGNVTGSDLTQSLTELAGANNISLHGGFNIYGGSDVFSPIHNLSGVLNAAACSVVFEAAPEPAGEPSGFRRPRGIRYGFGF